MKKEKCLTFDDYEFVDEIVDEFGNERSIYAGCNIKYFYFPDGNGIIIDSAEVEYNNEIIKTTSWNERKSVIETLENEWANQRTNEAQHKLDTRRGK